MQSWLLRFPRSSPTLNMASHLVLCARAQSLSTRPRWAQNHRTRWLAAFIPSRLPCDVSREIRAQNPSFPFGYPVMGYATYETRELAKRLRAELSTAELLLWDELRGRRLDGLKFRR